MIISRYRVWSALVSTSKNVLLFIVWVNRFQTQGRHSPSNEIKMQLKEILMSMLPWKPTKSIHSAKPLECFGWIWIYSSVKLAVFMRAWLEVGTDQYPNSIRFTFALKYLKCPILMWTRCIETNWRRWIKRRQGIGHNLNLDILCINVKMKCSIWSNSGDFMCHILNDIFRGLTIGMQHKANENCFNA